jgi:hypothetical protein
MLTHVNVATLLSEKEFINITISFRVSSPLDLIFAAITTANRIIESGVIRVIRVIRGIGLKIWPRKVLVKKGPFTFHLFRLSDESHFRESVVSSESDSSQALSLVILRFL